ncbi:hypothetical protein RHO12_02995 [Orbus sturtevantii]|uniref:hypothetical protein n=1 Tax=Orbus sturtevantii TaxID=3074109 RepID=UPI00370D67D3
MKKIEDVGLGEVKILEYGNHVSFELLSMYDGETIGNILCKNVKYFSLSNVEFEDDEGFEGAYIPLILINNLDDILKEKPFEDSGLINLGKVKGSSMKLEGFTINGHIICLDINVNIKAEFNHMLCVL